MFLLQSSLGTALQLQHANSTRVVGSREKVNSQARNISGEVQQLQDAQEQKDSGSMPVLWIGSTLFLSQASVFLCLKLCWNDGTFLT